MATTTRREILERKNAMLRDLRAAHHHGVALPGEMAVSQRELSAKYGLSVRTVSLELQKLVEEGVLYTVPRVGTFVGQPRAARDKLFLALFRYLDKPNIQWSAVSAGFEERIAHLGGTSLVLDFETARHYRKAGEIVAPAGIFELHYFQTEPVWLEPGVPHVEFGELENDSKASDKVYFDNADGGWKATRQLLALGHQKIAFMALHGAGDDPGALLWSQQREAGWRRALQEAGLSAEGLAFLPRQTPEVNIENFSNLAREMATELLLRDDITAIVAVNAHVAQGLFQELRAQEQEHSGKSWPAVVAFDSELAQSPGDAMHVVTTLRLPWEEIGRVAADLLWERAHGRLEMPQQRLVSMTLIPRLSCRQDWHRAPGVVSRHQTQVPAAA